MDKKCSHCKIVKSVEEFYKNGNGYCKTCWKEYRSQRWYLDYQKEYHYKTQYGLTMEEVSALKTECRICGEKEKELVIDHCHATGKVRGALCHRCNKVLGLVDDNKELLESMLRYL